MTLQEALEVVTEDMQSMTEYSQAQADAFRDVYGDEIAAAKKASRREDPEEITRDAVKKTMNAIKARRSKSDAIANGKLVPATEAYEMEESLSKKEKIALAAGGAAVAAGGAYALHKHNTNPKTIEKREKKKEEKKKKQEEARRRYEAALAAQKRARRENKIRKTVDAVAYMEGMSNSQRKDLLDKIMDMSPEEQEYWLWDHEPVLEKYEEIMRQKQYEQEEREYQRRERMKKEMEERERRWEEMRQQREERERQRESQ